MNFEIRSLKVGELYLPEGSGIMRDPVHVWLVRHDKTAILVDSGMPEIAQLRRTLHVDGFGGGHASLVAALAAEGMVPGDISMIVATHLHFDHAANLDLFPNACVVVQRDELCAAIDPPPTQRIYYMRETLIELINRKRPGGLRVIDGDLELMDGLTILKTPSHTDGMQVAVVTTARGRVALVSDLGDHYRYWFPADKRATTNPKRYLADSFMPGPIRSTSERDWLACMRRVLAHADIVVPAHDFRIPKWIPEEWFAIPDSTDGDLAHVPPDEMPATSMLRG